MLADGLPNLRVFVAGEHPERHAGQVVGIHRDEVTLRAAGVGNPQQVRVVVGVGVPDQRHVLEVAPAATDRRFSLALGDELVIVDLARIGRVGDVPVYGVRGQAHDDLFAGLTRREKLAQVHEILQKNRADLHLITTLDDIAWLFNLRGNDISFCPFFVSYCLTGPSGTILFIDPKKIPDTIRQKLKEDHVTLLPYDEFSLYISRLESGTRVYLAPGRITGFVRRHLPAQVKLVEGMNITTGLKAVKNSVEITGLKRVMVKDGIAWVRLLSWLHRQMEAGVEESEISIARKMADFRKEQENYLGESFHPISSYDWHGSIVHYSVTEEDSIAVHPRGIFLFDTGGHYLDGTTDTTRTVSLGETTTAEKRDFTLALKGTLGVSMLRFPSGTKGYQMDILARKALWNQAMNYGHGTGHGVGFLLSVHEGPQTIGTSASGYQHVIMEPGMVTTVEPAIYRDGSYGMRTENMTLVVNDVSNEFGEFYRFETLTLVPIDRKLIDKELLTKEELAWINQYHQKVNDTLSDHLDEADHNWLTRATAPLP